jgi:hypothetical protein
MLENRGKAINAISGYELKATIYHTGASCEGPVALESVLFCRGNVSPIRSIRPFAGG